MTQSSHSTILYTPDASSDAGSDYSVISTPRDSPFASQCPSTINSMANNPSITQGYSHQYNFNNACVKPSCVTDKEHIHLTPNTERLAPHKALENMATSSSALKRSDRVSEPFVRRDAVSESANASTNNCMSISTTSSSSGKPTLHTTHLIPPSSSPNGSSSAGIQAHEVFIQILPSGSATPAQVRLWISTWFTGRDLHVRGIEACVASMSWDGKDVRGLSMDELKKDLEGWSFGCYIQPMVRDLIRAREVGVKRENMLKMAVKKDMRQQREKELLEMDAKIIDFLTTHEQEIWTLVSVLLLIVLLNMYASKYWVY